MWVLGVQTMTTSIIKVQAMTTSIIKVASMEIASRVINVPILQYKYLIRILEDSS